MGYTFIDKDPESDVNGCPAVWVDDDRRLLIQGRQAGGRRSSSYAGGLAAIRG
ncbi:hypothetical protein GCM10010319_46180 [Streptomyces blastmyceticus]|uniref:Uncharacterized protein n=1 Tax=Streptomyces blastmyceticus TaxID=68180 RepID=A0ABN0XFY9_9ACTN